MSREARIRAAVAADVPVVVRNVEHAYRHYISRIGKPPGPMLDDYAVRVAEGVVWVVEQGATIVGIIVLLPKADYLLLDNIAVAPTHQGFGLGRQLLAFAEAEALRRGYREIRLYTHQKMIENQQLYAAIGYEERDAAQRRATIVCSFASDSPTAEWSAQYRSCHVNPRDAGREPDP